MVAITAYVERIHYRTLCARPPTKALLANPQM
jgi:hypothetical protein